MYRLPTAYPTHEHATEEHRTIAQEGMFFLTEVGSSVHGTSVAGTDDLDLMGLAFEPAFHVLGTVAKPFEQFERHTAWNRPGGVRNRSGHGDLDVTVYSVRKWAKLALAGNPTIQLLLFSPQDAILETSEAGAELLANYDKFVSQIAVQRYLGYLHGQVGAMLGLKHAHTNRPELVAVHGYDTKYAGHAYRLGVQGIELVTTGRIELPMTYEHRDFIQAVRRGEVPKDDALAAITDAENRLQNLVSSDMVVPPTPDYDWVNTWLYDNYTAFWRR